ncbi:MAG: RNA methyltransferase [Nitrososphaerota archaeon]|nr:RNA methyltransferase [Nitrososphaerota archaeon]
MVEEFSPSRRRVRVEVLIPSSFSREAHGPREKMIVLGMLARSLAAARVEALILYHEDPVRPDESNARMIKLVMDYLNTAPYLRKRLFGLRPELRFAGLLPPLNIPTHPEKPSLDYPHYREGLVVSSGSRSAVEAGLGEPVRVRRRLSPGSRVLVRVVPREGGRPEFRVRSRRSCEVYAGFKTSIVDDPLSDVVEAYDVKIATSRRGVDVRGHLAELRERCSGAKRICVAFGAAREGLYEIAERQGFRLEDVFDYVLNVMPIQGVRTIRTEEAVAYALSILNLALD